MPRIMDRIHSRNNPYTFIEDLRYKRENDENALFSLVHSERLGSGRMSQQRHWLCQLTADNHHNIVTED